MNTKSRQYLGFDFILKSSFEAASILTLFSINLYVCIFIQFIYILSTVNMQHAVRVRNDILNVHYLPKLV